MRAALDWLFLRLSNVSVPLRYNGIGRPVSTEALGTKCPCAQSTGVVYLRILNSHLYNFHYTIAKQKGHWRPLKMSNLAISGRYIAKTIGISYRSKQGMG